MSSQGRKLGLRYAKAFVRSSSSIEALKSEVAVIEQLGEAIIGDSSVRSFFLNPTTGIEKKVGVMDSLLSELGASSQVVRFVNAILTNKRIFAFSDIVRSLKELSMEKMGIVSVEVKSARELGDSEKKDVEGTLATKINQTLEFTWNVEPSLIGGLVVSYSGVVIDASLEGRLKEMEKSLLQ